MISNKINKALRLLLEWTLFGKKNLKKNEDGTFNIQQISLIPIFDQYNLQNINV